MPTSSTSHLDFTGVIPAAGIVMPASAAMPSPGKASTAKTTPDAPAEGADIAEGTDNNIYGEEDDAQSFIQPAISPMATRLSSPKTPALERAMAMDNNSKAANGGYFDAETTGSSVAKPMTAMPPAVQHSNIRLSRSSSVGTEALKRLSKALPLLSFPNSFLTASSLFSSSASPASRASPASLASSVSPAPLDASFPGATTANPPTRSSVAGQRSYVLRRTNSEDSQLYQSLSRMSSHGDTDQFEHVREQVNSRVKAIMDSFDRPTFKLPQLPLFSDGKATLANALPQDPLDAVVEMLTGDIVVLGGYRGSILRSAEPPHRQLWVPVKVGLNIRKVNMEVGLDPEDEETMEQRIFASGMLQNIGPVDISRRLFRRLRESENARQGRLRVHDYGYDWRLSPRLLSRRLIAFLETLPCNNPQQNPPGSVGRGAVVIAHSLGGLITRHAVNQRPDLFAGVIFAGTPKRCVNILGPLRNGDAVLLNEKVLTAQVNFSLRTTFAFLPEDGFCFVNNKNPSEEYRVNFYDIDDWLRYRWSPCVSLPPLPPLQHADSTGSSGTNGVGDSLLKRNSTIGALFEDLSGSLSSLPLRSRGNSNNVASPVTSPVTSASALAKDRLLEPQIDASTSAPTTTIATDPTTPDALIPIPLGLTDPIDPQRVHALAYLTRTLAETKQFRAEMEHRPEHTAANAYPPLAVVYGKGIPTVYAARVSSRAAIACSDAYDNLLFRSGDGVVLAREALLPTGYDYVHNGYISTDRGHVSMLGDLAAVGRALEAVVRGRRKGIGLGSNVAAASALQRRASLPGKNVTSVAPDAVAGS